MNRIDPASEALGLHRQFLTRRWFLQQCGVGLGAMALRHLMGSTAQASNPTAGNAGAKAHAPGAFNPLAPRAPHFAPRAKRVIFLFQAVGQPFAIIDCFCILDDAKIRRYFELGCEVKGMGRGHIRRIKDQVRGWRGR